MNKQQTLVLTVLAIIICSIANKQLANDCCLFDPTPTTLPENIDNHSVEDPFWVEFSPDGTCLAVVNRGHSARNPSTHVNTVAIFPFDQQTCTANPTPATILTSANGINFPMMARFSPNGKFLAVANKNGNTVTIYQRTDNSCTFNETPCQTINIVEPISLAFSPNGSCLAVGAKNNIKTYNFQDSCLTPPTEKSSISTSFVRALAFSPNGKYLAAASAESGQRIAVYPIENCAISGDPISTIDTGNANQGHSVAFSPDGTCIAYSATSVSSATSSLVGIRPFNQETGIVGAGGTTLTEVDGLLNPHQVVFSPDGSCLAMVNAGQPQQQIPGRTVNIYGVDKSTCTLTSATPIQTLTAHGPYSLAYSPNGSCLAVANRPRFFDVDTPDFVDIFKLSCPDTCPPLPTGKTSMFFDDLRKKYGALCSCNSKPAVRKYQK